MPSVLNALLPAPRSITPATGSFDLSGAGVTVATAELLPIATLLVERLSRWAGVELAAPTVAEAAPGGVHLAVDATDAGLAGIPAAHGVSADGSDLGAERYAIVIGADGVRLTGAAPAGVHRAATTLAQLAEQAALRGEAGLPGATIADGPALAWRGLSFDVVRQWFTLDEVRQVVDLLDRYRLNVLHLHLSDDQGWRIEIPTRPGLTTVPGSYFTQAEYAELVAYAAQRFVTIVPEIDLPGHSATAIGVYPELTRSGVAVTLPSDPHEAFEAMMSGRVTPQYLDPDKEEVWDFVNDVMAALAAVTPGSFVHIGGDEAFGMPQDEHNAFVSRAREVVRAHGKQPIGWQETIRAASAPGELVQLWIDLDTLHEDDPAAESVPSELAEAIREVFAEAANDPQRMVDQQAKVIMSRTGIAYLDKPYADRSDDPEAEALRARLGMPGYPPITIEAAATTPIAGIDEPTELDVVGFEAAIWGETIFSFADLTFLLLPRLPALAQRAWTSGPALSWDDLQTRLAAQAPAWRRDGYAYFAAATIPWR